MKTTTSIKSLFKCILSAGVLSTGAVFLFSPSRIVLFTFGIIFGIVLPVVGLLMLRYKIWRCINQDNNTLGVT